MAKAKTPTKAARKPAGKPAANAGKASPLPTPSTAKAQPAKVVALRGGAAVGKVKLTDKAYRTAAPHNVQWWATITRACAKGPATVADMLVGPNNPQGVPAAFVGYAMRRGYLAAA
jgi:hypothetical protein